MLTTSIAMTTFNGEAFIERQMQSLFAQTLAPIEIIICDDGSTDRTLEILERLRDHAPIPVRVHQNTERLVWRRNFLKASSLCEGGLIAFCDQDDLWEPHKLEAVTSVFTPDVAMVFHGARFIDGMDQNIGDMTPVASTPLRFAPLELDAFAKVLGFSMTFRRTLRRFDDLFEASIDNVEP